MDTKEPDYRDLAKELAMALVFLVDKSVRYNGCFIEIEAASHEAAMSRMSAARRALTKYREADKARIKELEIAADRTPEHEALRDLLCLQAEFDALNGGGPGWVTRWTKAKAYAAEVLGDEE